jgi:hypothetical protein
MEHSRKAGCGVEVVSSFRDGEKRGLRLTLRHVICLDVNEAKSPWR